MLKHKYLKLILFFIPLFAGLFLFGFNHKVSADDLTATPQTINGATFDWLDMSDVQVTFHGNPPGDKYTLDFFDGSAITHYPYSGELFTNQDQNAGCSQNGQTVIYAPSSGNVSSKSSSYAGSILWKYHLAGQGNPFCVSSNSNSDSPNVAIKIKDGIVSDGIRASNVFYKYSASDNTIGFTDPSLGSSNYSQCASDPNVYIQGDCTTGSCYNMLVVEPSNKVYLWPLSSTATYDSSNNETKINAPAGSEAYHLNIGGCDFVTPYWANLTKNKNSYNEFQRAFAGSGNANSTTGQILTAVPGFTYIKSSSTGPIASGNSNSSGSSSTYCDDTGGTLSWITCAIIRQISDVETAIEVHIINPLLTTNIFSFNANTTCAPSLACRQAAISSTAFKIWSTFRVYGNIVLILGLLVVVYSETIGGGVGEAYAAKKILPRLLVAAILINLSIYIVVALEDIFNILGEGIQRIIEQPFIDAHLPSLTVSVGAGRAFTLGLGAVALGTGFSQGVAGIALFVFGTVILAFIGVLVTLVFRQGLLFFLLLTSPIAFALYLLPNTEQYFRRWWSLLIRTLVVFPLVSAVFAMAYVTATIVSNLGIQPVIVAQLMAIFAAVIPLFLIPFAFRLSGGLIGSFQTQVSNAAKRIKQPIDKLRQANQADRLERARNNNLFRGDNFLARRGSSLAQSAMMANKAGLKPWKMRGKLRQAKSAQTSKQSAKAGESDAAATVLANDDLLNASIHGNGTERDARSYLQNLGQRGRELDQNVASITQARRDVGRDAFNDAAAAANAGTGPGYASGPAEMFETIARVAGNDKPRQARILAAARSNAERARRVDLYGAGFATSADQLSQVSSGFYDAATVNEVMTDEALYTKSAGEVGSSRNNAFTNMAPAIQRRTAKAQAEVEKAHKSGDTVAIQKAEHEQKRALAQTAAFLDVAPQVSPENIEVVGALTGQVTGSGQNDPKGDVWEERQVIDRDGNPAVDTTTNLPVMERVKVASGLRAQTVGDQIEALRTDPEFQQYRREYSAEAQAAAARGLPPGAPGAPGAPGTPGGAAGGAAGGPTGP